MQAQMEGTYRELMQNSKKWTENFDKPMKLGVKRKVTVITCMDSRLIPEVMLGLDVGDAEVIRNAGGRVTMDVIRSLVVTQDILDCKAILVIHHTDCGGMAVLREKDTVMRRVHDQFLRNAPLLLRLVSGITWGMSYFIPRGIRDMFTKAVTHGFREDELETSVVEDVNKLRACPIVDKDVALYGLTYDVFTGKFTEVIRDVKAGDKDKSYRQKLREE